MHHGCNLPDRDLRPALPSNSKPFGVAFWFCKHPHGFEDDYRDVDYTRSENTLLSEICTILAWAHAEIEITLKLTIRKAIQIHFWNFLGCANVGNQRHHDQITSTTSSSAISLSHDQPQYSLKWHRSGDGADRDIWSQLLQRQKVWTIFESKIKETINCQTY